MTKTLKEQIIDLRKKGVPVFYAENASPEYFKMFVRNISYAENLGLGKVKGEIFYPEKTVYVVNPEKECVERRDDPVPFIRPKPL